MAALETKPDVSPESAFATLFAKARASLAGPAWLHPLRGEALGRVLRDGLPHRRVEAWKFTDFRNTLRPALDLASGKGAPSPSPFDKIDAYRVELNGGKVARSPAADALPDGLEIITLADALAMPALWLRQWLKPGDEPLENLNLAFVGDGALVRVGRGLHVTQPVLIHSMLSEAGVMAHSRSIVVLEEGAELTLLEVDTGDPQEQSLLNSVTSIVLEPGARLRHVRISASGRPAFVVRTDTIELARDAAYHGVVLSSAAALARQQIAARLTGTGADLAVACAYAAGEAEHTDFALEIVHEAPHTTSRLLTKGVAAGGGHAVVQGRVIVKPEAQKTDSHQLSRALLLAPHAEIDQKPELEIFADDVKCGHGAAVGALDANQLFYLRARGIPEHEARNMLIAAFLGEVTERVGEPYRPFVEAWLSGRMAHVAGGAP